MAPKLLSPSYMKLLDPTRPEDSRPVTRASEVTAMTRLRPTLILVLLLLGLIPAPAGAQPQPSPELLLPYFEVDLVDFGVTTLFHLTNTGPSEVPVTMMVHSNWGIPLVEVAVRLRPEQTRSFNLRDWVLFGRLPGGETLGTEIRAHLQAALTGQPSPLDGHYYGSQRRPGVGVGYITIATPRAAGTLWGNYFIVDPDGDSAQGDVLVDVDRARAGHDLCVRHRLLFIEGGSFDGGTELLIWTGRRGEPSPTPAPFGESASLEVVARNEEGTVLSESYEEILSTSATAVRELAFPGPVGTLEVVTVDESTGAPIESFIGIRYRAEGRYSVGLQTFCQPDTGREPAALSFAP